MVAAKPKPPEPPTLKKVPLTASVEGDNEASLGSLVAEAWSQPIASTDGHRGFALTGSSRLFLVDNDADAFAPATVRSWSALRYKKLQLLGSKLEFTIDYSKVGCGCNGAVYLVAMDKPRGTFSSGYCDIQGYDTPDLPPCIEFDLAEGNAKAIQASSHTVPALRPTLCY